MTLFTAGILAKKPEVKKISISAGRQKASINKVDEI